MSEPQASATTPQTPLAPAKAPALTPLRSSTRRFPALRTIAALVLREMSTRYSRTPGGYVWNIMEPLAAILFLSLGFSLMLRSPALGTSFLLFYATGYLPFELYNTISRTCAASVNFSRPLLRFPAVTWVDALIARFLLNGMTSALTAFILIVGVLITLDTRTILDIPPILRAVGLSLLLGLGIGSLNCTLFGLYPLWGVIWGIVTRPLFLASGVLFLYEDVSAEGQAILWYNPLMHITGLMRTGFYPSYSAAYVNESFVLFVSLILLAFGVLLLGRYHRDLINI